MVSPTISQWLERARLQVGLVVEILDDTLNSVYPKGDTTLGRIIGQSPAARNALMGALASGRPQKFDDLEAAYRLYPLRGARGGRPFAGVLAVRQASEVLASDAEPWSELARTVIEADLAAGHTLHEERQRSRRLAGVLRFLEYVASAPDEQTLTRALVHAAAIWFDVDARIYRRTLSGGFELHAHLEGVRPDPNSIRLPHDIIADGLDSQRLASTADLGEVGAGHDAILVALSRQPRADWLLALLGHVPSDADAVFRQIGRAAGMQLEAQAERRASDMKARFEELVVQTKAPELVAMHLLRDLVASVHASTGSLTLTRLGQTRRIAAVGTTESAAASAPSTAPIRSADRMTWPMTVAPHVEAVLDVRASDGAFTPASAMVIESCATVLRTWLVGSLSTFDATDSMLDAAVAPEPAFSARIQEELARAQRFDLRLSLILIDVNAPSSSVAQLQDTVRRELRGSDVTGSMSGTRVAVLLTHTDAAGLDNVVGRLKQRLVDAAARLDVSRLRLGRAALSPNCRTADALLALALRQAEPLIVH
jgi:hypothetical protein